MNGARSLKRFRLVIAQKSKLRLTQETAALASHSRDHRLTASSFFPCSIDREYLYGYAGDGYRSPLWLCASHNGSPVLVHRLRGSKMYFHQATKDRRILLIPGIHYFDAHRLQPLLLQAPALQVHMRESSLVGPEGACEQVDDPSSDEEQATTASETEAESEDDDEATPPEEPWCPPIPPAMDDPTEQEIKGAADKLATMISSSQPSASVFYHPDNLGALPHLWLQAKLTISLTSMQEKFARLFMSIASELWLRRLRRSLHMLPGALPSGWPKRSRSTSALLLEEQSPWLPQRRSACYMPLSGFVQSSPSSLWQPERVQR